IGRSSWAAHCRRSIAGSTASGSECRHHLLAKAAHRGEVLVVAHIAKAGLAQQVLHASIAQLGDLVTHSRRRAVERSGGEHVFDRLVVADHGIGPGFSIAGSMVKSAGLYAARTCIMWARICSSRADSSSSACALDSAT